MNDTVSNEIVEEEEKPLYRKYRSLGLAVKAVDAEAVRAICVHLKSEGMLPVDDKERQPMSLLLWQAAGLANPEVMQVLIDFDAKPSFTLLQEGSSPLELYAQISVATHAVLSGKRENIEFLINNGHVKLNESNNNEHTLFMQAVLGHQFEVAEWLLSVGANIDDANLRGNTSLHIACGMPLNIEAIQWLVNKGASPLIEAVDRAVASQRIPPAASEDCPEFEMLENLYNELEDYAEAFELGNKNKFVFSEDIFKDFTNVEEEEDPATLQDLLNGIREKTKSPSP